MTPRKVLIVGGGTAGWMTAAHLNAVLNRVGRDVVRISLVEPPGAPVASVGVASLPGINRFLAVLGVDQREFMRRVSGTLSQGTKFTNWLLNEGDYFYHPFDTERVGNVDQSAQRWLKSNRSVPFSETASPQPALCELNLAPLMLSRWDFGPKLSYSFHVDESKFASYLREHTIDRGVEHHSDNVVDVEMTPNGDVAAVMSESGQRFEADLFIDCSGQEAVLSEKAMGIRWVDCSEWLLCDQALTMSVPYETRYPGFVHPYTTATALSAGWVRDVPLQDCRSLGYVHSSAYLSREQAEQELRAFEGVHSESLKSELVHYRVGHRESAWTGNCVSIGSANSFIEPLESTGLYMIDLAADMLVDHFPYSDNMAPLAYRYNRIMMNRYYEILDFVNLHYCLTRRRDSEFWREVQKPERINPRLKSKLDFWRIKRPTPSDFEDQYFPGQPDKPLHSEDWPGDGRSPVDTAALWDHENYEAILYGMQFLDAECDDWFGTERPNSVIQQNVAARLKAAPHKLPPHDVWLRQFCGMPDYRKSGG